MEDRIHARGLLLGEISQQLDGHASQRDDGTEVNQNHRGRKSVGQGPHQRDGTDGAAEHTEHDEHAENVQLGLGLGEVLHVRLGKVVVAQHGGKRQEEQNDCNEVSAPLTHLRRQRALSQVGRLHTLAIGRIGQQDDEGRDGTNHQRVEIYAQGLHQALLDRVGYRRGGRCVRGGALAGLVGEQATAHAVHERRTQGGTGDLLDAKSMLHDGGEHRRNFADVDGQHDHAQQNVGTGHKRDDHLGGISDALHAAEDNQRGQSGHQQARSDLQPGGIGRNIGVQGVQGGTRGLRDGVGLHGVVHKTVGDGDGDAEDQRQRLHAQPLGHVVRRATDVAILIAGLPQLRQRGLHEGSRAADEGDDPHPEHRARAAQGNGDSHAHHVACAHAGRCRDAESLECGDVLSALADRRFLHRAEHVRHHADLHYQGANAEVSSGCEQEDGDDLPNIFV